MIQAQNITKGFGERTLFEGLTWRVDQGVRYGLVGPNGVGKTTLLRILCGELAADEGTVVQPKGTRIGYLPQEVDPFVEGSVVEVVLDGVPGWRDAHAQLAALHLQMAEDPAWAASDVAMTQLARATEAYDLLGGDALEARARTALGGLGFRNEAMEAPAARLSGGWQMRAALARLLAMEPDILLLDEPTNHLDFETLAWFEDVLDHYPGAVVAVSHDRYFLDRVPDRIAELRADGIREYLGGYERWIEGRDARVEQQKAEQRRVDRKRAHLESFVERFRAKASKARQAQSRIKQLARLEHVAVDEEQGRIQLVFPKVGRVPSEVMASEHVVKRYGDTQVYDDLSLVVWRKQRIALVGPNGAGKSTLLRILAGATDIQGGTVRRAAGVRIEYFAQHQLETLDARLSVYEEARRAAADTSVTMVRSVLGALSFSGDSVDKRVNVLSGGEKARLALAKMILRAPEVLLLDEPTNHLDLLSREVLEQALAEFGGTVVLVSHDRWFVNAVATHVLEVEPGGRTTLYAGDYDAWLYHKSGGDPALVEKLLRGEDPRDLSGASGPSKGDMSVAAIAAPRDDAEPAARDDDKARRRQQAERRNQLYRLAKPLRSQIAAFEAEIEKGEARLAILEVAQADPSLYADGEAVRKVLEEHGRLRLQVNAALAGWEAATVELEAVESEAAG